MRPVASDRDQGQVYLRLLGFEDLALKIAEEYYFEPLDVRTAFAMQERYKEWLIDLDPNIKCYRVEARLEDTEDGRRVPVLDIEISVFGWIHNTIIKFK